MKCVALPYRNGVVGTVTRLGTELPGFRTPVLAKHCLHPVPYSMCLGVNRPGQEVGQLPASNVEVKNEWGYISTPPTWPGHIYMPLRSQRKCLEFREEAPEKKNPRMQWYTLHGRGKAFCFGKMTVWYQNPTLNTTSATGQDLEALTTPLILTIHLTESQLNIILQSRYLSGSYWKLCTNCPTSHLHVHLILAPHCLKNTKWPTQITLCSSDRFTKL